MSFLDELRLMIEEFLWSTGWTVPPLSGIFFIFVTIAISLFSNLLNRLLLDMDQMKRDSEEMSEHNAQKNIAMREGDTKLWIRVKRNEQRMQELQQKQSMTRMLPMLITYAPIIFVFTTLRQTFQASANILLNGNPACQDPAASCGGVVILPFKAHTAPLVGGWFSPFAGDLSISIAGFGFWYFLTAIVVSTLLSKVLGVNLSGTNQMR